MTWRIDQPVRVGAGVFAAIVEVRIDVRGVRHAVLGHGEKRPILYLLVRGDAVSGMDVQGKSVTRAEIERRFPTAIEQLGALLGEAR